MIEYQNLSQFYTGREWREFRKLVIAERINKEDGVLYDEWNGQPLLNDYDTILHHKIELTINNVNDRSISLNPDNIMIVSIKSHNEIHNRWGGRKQNYQRKVYYVYGAPLSGKSTFVKENMQRGDLVLDIDKLWQALSGQERYDKPNELKRVVLDTKDFIIDKIKLRAGTWQTAWVIEGGASPIKRKSQIETLGAESIFIDTSKEECLKRLYEDTTRRNVIKEWEGYIDKWFEEYRTDDEVGN